MEETLYPHHFPAKTVAHVSVTVLFALLINFFFFFVNFTLIRPFVFFHSCFGAYFNLQEHFKGIRLEYEIAQRD